jgi:hypothetical protein
MITSYPCGCCRFSKDVGVVVEFVETRAAAPVTEVSDWAGARLQDLAAMDPLHCSA